MHSVYNYYTKQLIARTPCDVELAQIKRECEFNQVFYYVETTVEPDNDATADNTAMTYTEYKQTSSWKYNLLALLKEGVPHARLEQNMKTVFHDYCMRSNIEPIYD